MMNFTRWMKWVPAAAIFFLLSGSMASAQTNETAKATQPQLITQTFYLTNATPDKDQSEILLALRNTLSQNVHITQALSSKAIVVKGAPDDIQLARKIISDLDRPRKMYRLTYTTTDMDGDKRVGTQHFSMVATEGQKVSVKQGNKVPYTTGSFGKDDQAQQTQYQYADIGMNFEATVFETEKGVKLQTRVEQSSVAPAYPGSGSPNPVIRQAVFQGTTYLISGKPQLLGSMDVPDTTRHLDIDVMVEPIS